MTAAQKNEVTSVGKDLHRGIVGVVGAGAMGSGIAQIAALAGHPVRLFDAKPGAAERGCALIRENLEKLAGKRRISPEEQLRASERLMAVTALSGLEGARVVVEAIVEELGAKQELFGELEQILGAEAILATNTSSLSITALAAKLNRPERVAGFHFFNPAPVMPLVEVVAGLATSGAVLNELYDLAESWGKKPVRARSTPGFIVNRVARPFYGEALKSLEMQVASPATVDAVLKEGGGFRMGPFELMDLIGHDVNFSVTRSVFDAFFGDRRYLPSLIQQELVLGGWLGRKSGRGFYDYAAGAVRPGPATHPPCSAPAAVHIKGSLGPAERLVPLLERRGIPVSRAEGDGTLSIPGATLALTDGRMATTRVLDGVPRDLVVFDLAFDYESATRIALAPAAQAPASALDCAAGLFQAIGKAVSPIADTPGLLVMRTVAMLANEAMDAVAHGVASSEDIDRAMTFGVNYPVGPLAWAQRVGEAMLLEVLQNLQRIYGDARYRPSISWWRAIAGDRGPRPLARSCTPKSTKHE